MLSRIPALMHACLALAALAALALLAGCGDQEQSDDSGQQVDGSDGDGGGDDPAALDLEEAPDYGDPIDLPEGVAATVHGEEIAKETAEERFEAVANVPEVAQRLEGEEGDAVAEAYRAQIVQNLITQALVAQSAEEMGLEPSDKEVAEVKDRMIAEFEGEERFAEALQAEGVTSEQLNDELLFAARVEAIRDEVADEFDADDAELGEEADLDPADLALHEWFGQRLASADVEVDREYGVWSPQSGEVVPPNALEQSE